MISTVNNYYTGNGWDVYAQFYKFENNLISYLNSDLSPSTISKPFRLNQETVGNQSVISISTSELGLMVTWYTDATPAIKAIVITTPSFTLRPTMTPTSNQIIQPTLSPTLTPTPLHTEVSVTTQVSKEVGCSSHYVVESVIVPIVCTVTGVLLTVVSKLSYNKIAHGKYFIQNPPIGISLDHSKEINLVNHEESKVKFDYYDNSKPLKTSWVGPNDAILVYDHNDNKQVDFAKEIILTEWCVESKTDFEALLCKFDSNKDRVFNEEDQEFSKFYLWQDKNQDGVSQDGELISLKEDGILSINFNTQEEIQGNLRELGALNKAEVLWADSKITYAYDLVFTHDVA